MAKPTFLLNRWSRWLDRIEKDQLQDLVKGSVCSPLVPLEDVDVRADLKRLWP